MTRFEEWLKQNPIPHIQPITILSDDDDDTGDELTIKPIKIVHDDDEANHDLKYEIALELQNIDASIKRITELLQKL